MIHLELLSMLLRCIYLATSNKAQHQLRRLINIIKSIQRPLRERERYTASQINGTHVFLLIINLLLSQSHQCMDVVITRK